MYASTVSFGYTTPPSTTFVAVATLGMDGWLALTQRGLSPLKKRQASLGAPTAWVSPADAAGGRQVQTLVMRYVAVSSCFPEVAQAPSP